MAVGRGGFSGLIPTRCQPHPPTYRCPLMATGPMGCTHRTGVRTCGGGGYRSVREYSTTCRISSSVSFSWKAGIFLLMLPWATW
jgi:hypothetical protein